MLVAARRVNGFGGSEGEEAVVIEAQLRRCDLLHAQEHLLEARACWEVCTLRFFGRKKVRMSCHSGTASQLFVVSLKRLETREDAEALGHHTQHAKLVRDDFETGFDGEHGTLDAQTGLISLPAGLW